METISELSGQMQRFAVCRSIDKKSRQKKCFVGTYKYFITYISILQEKSHNFHRKKFHKILFPDTLDMCRFYGIIIVGKTYPMERDNLNERLPYLREKTGKLTTKPGVYRMRDKTGNIIYVGKAKNLKNRVTSYFRENPDHTPKVAKMVSHVYDYDFIVTDTEYEALVLECSMIKQFSPKYNILLKDDKGYHYIRISDDPYPRITAEKQKSGGGKYLGPYTGGFVTTQTVNEVNKVFMLPTCHRKFPQDFGKYRPCLNHHIGQCMGVCMGKISENEYAEIIKDAEDYIRSGSRNSVEKMTEQMNKAAEELDFELAAKLRDRIRAVSKAADTQKIMDSSLPDTDVIAFAQNGSDACVSVLTYRGGRLFDRYQYFLGDSDSEEEMCADFILQYYSGEREIPRMILVENELTDSELIHSILRERCGHAVELTTPQRGRLSRLTALAKSNSEEFLSVKVGRTGKEIAALEELAKLLGLGKTPLYIESYDISNLASTSMVAGMIVFENGRPQKKAYKRFSIKENVIQNDVGCMQEVLRRRFEHYLDENEKDEGFARLPDLILLDGGQGQINAVEPLLREMGINVPVFGMVKDSKHRTRAVTSSGGEIAVPTKGSAFMLVTRIQDEVHRFAISYQRSRHSKNTFALEITKIKGIGEKKAQKLYLKFKTKDALRAASPEEIAQTAGINAELARQVYEFIQNQL